jgi:hypothetical protein
MFFQPIHRHNHVGKGGHEALRGRGDRGSPDRRPFPLLIVSDPCLAKNAATLAAFCLHQRPYIGAAKSGSDRGRGAAAGAFERRV